MSKNVSCLFVKGELLVSEFREIQLLGKNETFSMDYIHCDFNYSDMLSRYTAVLIIEL